MGTVLRSTGSLRLPTTPTVRYEYDANDQRVLTRRAASLTFHVGKLYEREDAAGASTHRYRVMVDGAAVAEIERTGTNRNARFIHRDWRGSPTLVTGAGGTVLEHPRFDAFGKPISGTGNAKVGFTGHRPVDETGLIDMGGRFYDPTIARFVSADPFVHVDGRFVVVRVRRCSRC